MPATRCWPNGATCSLPSAGAHVRRHFYELAQGGAAPIASEALTRIAALYRIEGEIRGRSAEERRAVRQQRSLPLVEALQALAARETVADQPEDQARRSDPLRLVALGRPVPLSRRRPHRNRQQRGRAEPSGRLPSTRKNALFAGSDGGAEHWAVIASLIETCKLLGVEPHAYLADVITRIVNGHPQTRLDELLPWAYPVMRQLQVVA